MRRVAKPEGLHNIVIEEVETPGISPTEVLVKTERTLISRGSEIGARYTREGPVDPAIMGYSQAGVVAEVGAEVEGYSAGDRVASVRPHAEYVVVDTGRHSRDIIPIPEGVSFEAATFWPLTTSSVRWMQEAGIARDRTLVILGQGLVGSLCMQVARQLYGPRIIAVDALPLRCELARELGADEVVDASVQDPVEAIRGLTGEGADVVVEAVGGKGGAKAFEQAQGMLNRGGLLHVLGLYENEPLPLYSNRIQGRRLLGGYVDLDARKESSLEAMSLLESGVIATERMITHRFPFHRSEGGFRPALRQARGDHGRPSDLGLNGFRQRDRCRPVFRTECRPGHRLTALGAGPWFQAITSLGFSKVNIRLPVIIQAVLLFLVSCAPLTKPVPEPDPATAEPEEVQETALELYLQSRPAEEASGESSKPWIAVLPMQDVSGFREGVWDIENEIPALLTGELGSQDVWHAIPYDAVRQVADGARDFWPEEELSPHCCPAARRHPSAGYGPRLQHGAAACGRSASRRVQILQWDRRTGADRNARA